MSSGRDRRPARQNGAAIAAFRAKEGKSQNAFAKEVGIAQSSLSEIESETVSAHNKTIRLIAQSLDIPVAAILRECRPAQPAPETNGAAA
jgi:transcriptional regulator with XRE-family HTH domain